jgi:hypothetical protein
MEDVGGSAEIRTMLERANDRLRGCGGDLDAEQRGEGNELDELGWLHRANVRDAEDVSVAVVDRLDIHPRDETVAKPVEVSDRPVNVVSTRSMSRALNASYSSR